MRNDLKKCLSLNPKLTRMKRTYFLLFLVLPMISSIGQPGNLTTFYERSGYLETPRYDETIEYCRLLDQSSEMVTYSPFGKSPAGRDLPLLILDIDGLDDPEKIRARGRSILLIQACIHPGESEGKEAGLLLFRNFITGIDDGENPLPDHKLLQQISVVFIPIFNVDGHERFGPYNRINQNGPKEMGWRTTATNLNLNRDYLKADSPEMQQWLRLFSHWMPDFFIDIHTTDGADYQYPLTYLMEIYGNMDQGLTRWCRDTFIPKMESAMQKAGSPVFPYVRFRNWHDPRSGLITDVAPPMLSQSYTALRNRPGLLIETHMLKPYRQRVNASYQCILSSMVILSEQKEILQKSIFAADNYASSEAFLKEQFPLNFEASMKDSVMTEFLGIDYTIGKSDLTGGDWFHYNGKPVTMNLPWFQKSVPVAETVLPLAYIIPVEWQEVIARLRFHGIVFQELKTEKTITCSTYRFRQPKWQQNPYEGRHPMTNLEYDEIEITRSYAAGSVVVKVSQPAARIIAHLLEPKGDGSLLHWGFMDAIFEQKEYGESYVVEKLAREMISQNPKLREEFEEKKKTDPNFAKNQWEMINWFYNRSPFADPWRMVYPVGKITGRDLLNSLISP